MKKFLKDSSGRTILILDVAFVLWAAAPIFTKSVISVVLLAAGLLLVNAYVVAVCRNPENEKGDTFRIIYYAALILLAAGLIAAAVA